MTEMTANWLAVIRGEYLELPGMTLSIRQASRLWSLEETTCRHLLEYLAATGFLTRGADGTFRRTTTRP